MEAWQDNIIIEYIIWGRLPSFSFVKTTLFYFYFVSLKRTEKVFEVFFFSRRKCYPKVKRNDKRQDGDIQKYWRDVKCFLQTKAGIGNNFASLVGCYNWTLYVNGLPSHKIKKKCPMT